MPRSEITPRSSRFVLFASICIVIAALYFAQEVLVPLALAMILSFLLTPLCNWLERRGLGRVPAVLTVVIASLAVVVVIAWVVGFQAYHIAEQLPQYAGNIKEKLDWLPKPGEGVIGKVEKTIKQVTTPTTAPTTGSTTQSTTAPAALQPIIPAVEVPSPVNPAEPALAPTTQPIPVTIVQQTSPFQYLWANASTFLGPLGTAGIVIVFYLFMLLGREDLRDRMIRLIGGGRLTVTTQALDDAATRISRYLMMQSIVNGTYGLTIAVGLWLIGRTVGGIPFPSCFLWGLLCTVLRFIPYIGPWIAAAFPMALSLAVYPHISVFFCVVGLFVIIELISNNFMEPWLYGSSTGMSEVAILVAAVFWTWLWGPIGLLLSTPLTVCLVVIGKYVPQLQFLDILLGDEPVLDPPERVYQRLLALDQEEVMDVVDEYLNERSLEEVFDDILLPAMAMAEQDRHRGRLDDRRQKFIRQSMRDVIEELGDRNRALAVKTAAEDTVKEAKNGATKEKPKRPQVPENCTINILMLPAHDEADEIVGLMLAQLLQLRGYCVVAMSQNALASEMVEAVEKKQANVVVVSALPPAAVSHSRYLCKRLTAKYPSQQLVVGLWTMKGNLERARERITCSKETPIVTNLGDAEDQIYNLVHGLITEATTTTPVKTG
jgi:predicted PurR-regulated permease PerM